MDLLEAVRETQVVVQVLKNERADPAVWDALYYEAVYLEASVEVMPSTLRRTSKQQHRDKHPASDSRTYWRISLYYQFLDHLVQEISDRILKNADRFAAQTLIPSRVQSVKEKDKDISAVCECYAADLQCERQQLDQEVNRWKVRWSLVDADKQPKTLLDALKACGSAYPRIQLILTELLTMPATSASCERSFSSMKRIKT
ncbi:uncharacterized protein LOC127870872 [Dreissena polymorpha]|uniref:HAT C-terminal dimerisation domain-containing protein n=1 Tax=Dreissena polymorpha TaxID=45954 RepID=A0A9D4MK07_DREPO|nr:uncharacterized protein LOC127870872 [Dreissena polymorpha]KAH3877089.1 hypothetical protein DPMN_000945 [Dreissena polymorpha]